MKSKFLALLMTLVFSGCQTTGSLQDVATKVQNQISDFQKQLAGAPAAEVKLFEFVGATQGSFKDIFKNTKRPDLKSSDTGWPRVAITYVEWGGDLICWKVRADIWKSQTAHTVENLKICDVPYALKDDIGQESQLTTLELGIINTLLINAQSRSDWRNTDANRTTGPTPPKYTWKISIAGSTIAGLSSEGDRLRVRESAIATRIALISSWYEIDKAAPNPKARVPQVSDARLWFVKFESKQ
jgi:hypothetical protein